MECDAVFESHCGDVAIDTVAEIAAILSAVANILHLDAPTVRFRNVDAVFPVDAYRGGVIDLILSGELRQAGSLGNEDLGEFRRRLKLGLKRKGK